MKRKRESEINQYEKPTKKRKTSEKENLSVDEQRIQRNVDYLNSLKDLLSQYSQKQPDNIIEDNSDEEDEEEMDDDEDRDEKQKELLLEKIKENIFQKRNLICKDYEKQLSRKANESDSSSPQFKTEFIRCHRKTITDLCFQKGQNNGDETVFSVSKDGCLIQTNLQKQQKQVFKKNRTGNYKELYCVDCNDDGNLVCFGGKDHNIYVFDVRQGKVIHELDGHDGYITDLKFRFGGDEEHDSMETGGKRNKNELLSSSMDNTIKFWDARKELLFQTLCGHVDEVQSVHCLMEDYFVSSSADASVRLWNLEKQKQYVFEGGHLGAHSIDRVRMLHKDCFVSGSQDGRLCLWSTLQVNPLFIFKNAHGGEWISALQTFEYSNICFSGSCDGFLKIWSVKLGESEEENEQNTMKLINEIPIPGWINGIDVEKNGKFLVCGGGSEHRLGRWKVLKQQQNGIHFIKLQE